MKRTVLVVDDETNMQAVMRMILAEAGYRVLTAGSAEEAAAHVQDPDLDVVLTDLKMPGMGGEAFVRNLRQELPQVPVIVITAHGTIRSAVKSIHDGAADYLAKPFEPEQLEIVVHNAIKLRDILRENELLRAAVGRASRRMIGASPAAKLLRDEIERVAPYKTNVLITGESGTGKELVARTIHEQSPRHAGPWVAINCAAIPRDLMESELFGYVKGAFTGAMQNRPGRLEQAHGGTLFLDEIAEIDLSLQAKLLRVLQEREYSPVGSDQVRSVDVRFIAASNRNVKERVAEGKFREDLYYRLDVYSIVVPPLRARRDDIALLTHAFLAELVAETGKKVAGISPDALQAMSAYPWPGNIRELRNSIERALLSCRSTVIERVDLPPSLLAGATNNDARFARFAGANLDDWLAEIERQSILEALAKTGGVQARAAKSLGVSERSLWHRIKKLGIQISRVSN